MNKAHIAGARSSGQTAPPCDAQKNHSRESLIKSPISEESKYRDVTKCCKEH